MGPTASRPTLTASPTSSPPTDSPTWGDNFGTSVAMSCNRVVVGAYQDDDQGQSSGSVYTFTRQPAGEWVQTHKIVPTDGARIDYFGYQVAVSSHTVAAGAPRNLLGSAYVRDVCDS